MQMLRLLVLEYRWTEIRNAVWWTCNFKTECW